MRLVVADSDTQLRRAPHHEVDRHRGARRRERVSDGREKVLCGVPSGLGLCIPHLVRRHLAHAHGGRQHRRGVEIADGGNALEHEGARERQHAHEKLVGDGLVDEERLLRDALAELERLPPRRAASVARTSATDLDTIARAVRNPYCEELHALSFADHVQLTALFRHGDVARARRDERELALVARVVAVLLDEQHVRVRALRRVEVQAVRDGATEEKEEAQRGDHRPEVLERREALAHPDEPHEELYEEQTTQKEQQNCQQEQGAGERDFAVALNVDLGVRQGDEAADLHGGLENEACAAALGRRVDVWAHHDIHVDRADTVQDLQARA
mmetsp:Transcript_13201/g.41048  ORF Transcript_13201/g.41048 Transcript_13201/m.41048 type:complete len:329 (-) Transcript_13201:254-1240(-)